MNPRRRPYLARSVAAILAALVAAGRGWCVDGTWIRLIDGNAGGTLTSFSNWLDGQVADGVDAVADFSTLDIETQSTLSINFTEFRAGTLKFQDAGNATNDWVLGTSSSFPNRLRLDVSSGQAGIQVLNRAVTVNAVLEGNDGIRVGNGGGPGGRLILNAPNTFTGGLTVSGAIAQLRQPGAAGGNTITVEGTDAVSRLEISLSSGSVANPIVIQGGVTPGAGHGAIEAAGSGRVSGSITINGPTGDGGHFASSSTSSGVLVVSGAIASSVPVVQAGGRVQYTGGGNYTAISITGIAEVANRGFSPLAAVSIGAAGTGDGTALFLAGSSNPVPEFNFGRSGSTDRGRVVAENFQGISLTGNVTTQGDATHRIEAVRLILGAIRPPFIGSTFSVADGANEIDLEVVATIAGSLGFTKAGEGTLSLTGTVVNSGPVAIDAGALAGNVTIAGPLSVAAGGRLIPGTRDTAGTITAPSITFGTGATSVDFNVGMGGDFLAATASGGLRLDGTTTLNFSTIAGPLANGVYDIIGYTGTIQGAGFAGFQAILPGRTIGTLIDTGSAVGLEVTGSDAATSWTGAANGVWAADATPNWKLLSNGAPTGYLEGDDVTFDDSGANPNVTLDEPVRPFRVAFENSTGVAYSIAGTGGLNGTMTLTKMGAGTVTLRTVNGYIGATTIGEGTLEVDHTAGRVAVGSESADLSDLPAPADWGAVRLNALPGVCGVAFAVLAYARFFPRRVAGVFFAAAFAGPAAFFAAGFLAAAFGTDAFAAGRLPRAGLPLSDGSLLLTAATAAFALCFVVDAMRVFPFAARFPMIVPATAPAIAPMGPAMTLPITAPVTPPAVCLDTGNSLFALREETFFSIRRYRETC